MRGHTELIEMRLQGLKPELVFLVDRPLSTKWRELTDSPEVSIYDDRPERADLRFLVGLMVSTGSATENRAKEILEACKRAGALAVGVVHLPANRADTKTNDYLEIWNAAHPA